MGEKRRTWEEEMYWTHFRCIYFTQTFLNNFARYLPLPVKVTQSLKNIPEAVTLISPSGDLWKVGLTTVGDMSFFVDGWGEFVKVHRLNENDLLVFKYDGVSLFRVLMFDGGNQCEKEAAYFARRGEGYEGNGSSASPSKRKALETSDVFMDGGDNDDDDDGVADRRTHTKIQAKKSDSEPDDPGTEHASHDGKSVGPSEHSSNKRTQQPENFDAETDDQDAEHASLNQKKVGQSERYKRAEYLPNRRPVTEGEKANALQLASVALSDKGFMMVMKPGSVYRRFSLPIPIFWIKKHLPSLPKKKVVLCVGEITWHSIFHWREDRNYGEIRSGWKKFALDNMLHEDDVCVFEPDCPKGDLMVLKVAIFRVLQEAKPLIRKHSGA